MIITRENIKEEASNLNDEILNLEKKYGVNIIALAQVESLDTEEVSGYLVMANRVSLDRCVNSVVHLVQTAQEGFGIKLEMFFAEAIKRTVVNERAFYDVYEVYCRISLGSFFIPSSYKNSQIYLCEPCLKKLSEKIAKQLQNEGD